MTKPLKKPLGNNVDLKAAGVYLLSYTSAYVTVGPLLVTDNLHIG
jgi:hypothetical protein